jgi:hypothetical protein
MGAALTYARRYALFTLVGIAGEDDIDAPDLNAPAPAGLTRKNQLTDYTGRNGRQKNLARNGPANNFGSPTPSQVNPSLKGQLSAVLRDRLIGQLGEIDSSESAAIWARRILPAKNSLTSDDARR